MDTLNKVRDITWWLYSHECQPQFNINSNVNTVSLTVIKQVNGNTHVGMYFITVYTDGEYTISHHTNTTKLAIPQQEIIRSFKELKQFIHDLIYAL